MAGGDELGMVGMGAFIENAQTLSDALGGVSVMPIHHFGKDTGAGMRGSTALLGASMLSGRSIPEVKGVLKAH